MFQLPAFDSMYSVLRFIVDNPKINLYRFHKGNAECPTMGYVRVSTGETVREESMGHACLASKRVVGLDRDNLFLTVARDKSSRILDDGSFGYRTIVIASPSMGDRVDSIEILPNFSSEWVKIDLSGLPVFPKLEASDAVWFGEKMVELHQLLDEKEFLTKQMDALKRKMDKGSAIVARGFRYRWEDPNGFSKGVADSNGEKVKTEAISFSNGFQLIPEFEKKAYERISDSSRIVEIHQKREEISQKIESLHRELRPYELGIIERLTIFESICIGGVNFNLKKFEVKRYDYPEVVAEKIEKGEYRIVDVPKSRGRWVCEPIPVPSNPSLVPTS